MLKHHHHHHPFIVSPECEEIAPAWQAWAFVSQSTQDELRDLRLDFGHSLACLFFFFFLIQCALKLDDNYRCFLEEKMEIQRGHSTATELTLRE